jgi:hypothetical protein
MTEILLVMWRKHIQVRSCFVHLIAKNTTVKTEFKMYYKYNHMQI